MGCHSSCIHPSNRKPPQSHPSTPPPPAVPSNTDHVVRPPLVDPDNVNIDLTERQLPPVPDSKSKKKATVIYIAEYDFQCLNKDDLGFVKGDRLEVDKESQKEGDWWIAKNIRTGDTGYVPSNYIRLDDDKPQNQEWFMDMSRHESDRRLTSPGVRPGHFLVRHATDNENLVLSVRDQDTVRHYKILHTRTGEFYLSTRLKFNSVTDLIHHHQQASQGLCIKLTDICPKTTPILSIRDLEVKRKHIKLIEKIGSGYFGQVWKGALYNKVNVAIKTLKPGSMDQEAFLEEAKNMHRLRHSNLVRLIAVCTIEEPILIITELMENGSLLDHLRKDGGKRIGFAGLLDMAEQITCGMVFLEEQNFIHRDLRAANILVDANATVKVADFGLVRFLDDVGGIYSAAGRSKFPVKWTAPEAAVYSKFSIKSDVWSFGVVLYEMITFGRIPYPGMSGSDVLRQIQQGYHMPKPTSPIIYSDAYYEVMLKCWLLDPEDRPTFLHLHQIFENFDVSTEREYD